MKKKGSLLTKVYIEAIIYCIIIVFTVAINVYGSFYIKILPSLFVLGIFGRVLFDKKYMTTVFSAIMALTMLQIKGPSNIVSNMTSTLEIIVFIVIGEICGKLIKEIIIKLKGKKDRNIINEGIKIITLLVIFTILHILLRGNYFTYIKCSEKLQDYFSKEYKSTDRFEVLDIQYEYYIKPQYIFYVNDKVKNHAVKFTIFPEQDYYVEDKYMKTILVNKSNSLKDDLESELDNTEITVSATYINDNSIRIKYYKRVENINKEQVENYAKSIVNSLENIKNNDQYDIISEIEIAIDSSESPKDSLAAVIYMIGYKEMEKNGLEQPYQYIFRALNIEYFE